MALFENDWFIACAVAGFLGMFALAVVMSVGSRNGRAASRREPPAPDHLRQQFDKTCRKWVDELDRRIHQIDELIKVADHRILELGEKNTLLEESLRKAALLKLRPEPAGRAAQAADAAAASQAFRDLNAQIQKTLADLKRDIADHKRHVEDKIAFLSVLQEPVAGEEDAAPPDAFAEPVADAPASGIASSGESAAAGFSPYESGWFPVEGDDDSVMRQRMRDAQKLAESGFPVEEICRTLRMERKAVEMILGLSGIRTPNAVRERVA